MPFLIENSSSAEVFELCTAGKKSISAPSFSGTFLKEDK